MNMNFGYYNRCYWRNSFSWIFQGLNYESFSSNTIIHIHIANRTLFHKASLTTRPLNIKQPLDLPVLRIIHQDPYIFLEPKLIPVPFIAHPQHITSVSICSHTHRWDIVLSIGMISERCRRLRRCGRELGLVMDRSGESLPRGRGMESEVGVWMWV